ncbi:uncharacterized protein BN707_01789 [Bacteroides fragilis CAG:558]|nr:uncharacterized protein BN707_01789 [Bacteroides fragilis CAG:558]
MPPTLRSMAISLSLSIISRLFAVDEALFRPSKASPPLMDPSPITATTWRSRSPFRSAATAMPSAAEMELEACPQVNVSYSLSSGEGKGRIPPSLRLVEKASRRPVSILCP